MAIQAQLADGRTLEFPDGTDPSVIQATVKKMIQGGGQPKPAQQPRFDPSNNLGDMFAPAPIAEQRVEQDKQQDLEQLRQVDPYMAEQVESTGPVQAAVVGAGRSLSKLGNLVGLGEPEDPRTAQTMEALGNQQPSMGVGEFIGEAAPFAAVGGPLANLAKTAVGKIGAGAALGAAEGGITTAADGGDAGDIAINTALGGAIGGVAGKLFGGKTRLTGKQNAIVKELEANPANPDFAKFLVVEGKPQASKQLGQAARAFGGREGNEFVAVAKNGSKADKQATRRMLATIKKGRVDPLFRDANRVGDVVGDGLTKRVNDVHKIKTQAGAKLDTIAKNDLPKVKVDISEAKQAFDDALTELRVGIAEDGALDFTQSAFRGSNAGTARNMITDIHQSVAESTMKGSDAHFLKKLIDNEVTFGKAEGGLSGDLDRAVKGLRAGLNKSIRDVSPKYGAANDKYSGALTALDNLQSAGGSKLDLNSPSAVGVALRRLTSNAQSRAPLQSSLDEIEGFLRNNGVRYNNSISHQNHIANALEKRFKLTGGNTLQGQQAQAIAQEARKGPTDIAIDIAAKQIDKVAGKTDEKAIESLLRAIK